MLQQTPHRFDRFRLEHRCAEKCWSLRQVLLGELMQMRLNVMGRRRRREARLPTGAKGKRQHSMNERRARRVSPILTLA